MQETLPPQSPSTPQGPVDPFEENLKMNRDMQAKREQELQEKAAAEAAEAARRARRIDRLKTAGAAVVGFGSIAGVGALAGYVAGEHAENNADKNQQWYDEAKESEREFYQENNILPPEMQDAKDQLELESTVPADTIPSPEQTSVQFVIPSPEQKD